MSDTTASDTFERPEHRHSDSFSSTSSGSSLENELQSSGKSHGSVSRSSGSSTDLHDSGVVMATALEQIVQKGLSRHQAVGKHDVLTKEDRELLLLNSNTYHFADGDNLFDGYLPANTIFWVLYGNVKVYDEAGLLGLRVPGSMIGCKKHLIKASAVGDVVLKQLDLEYVKKLVANDEQLGLRFYRKVAQNFATVVRSVFDETEGEVVPPITSPKKKLQICKETCQKPTTVRVTKSRSTGQVFPVTVEGQKYQCQVRNSKLKFKSNTFGFTRKRGYKYKDIQVITRTSPTSLTIITKSKRGNTFFLDDEEKTSHLYQLLQSVLQQASTPSQFHNHATLTSTGSSHSLSASQYSDVSSTSEHSSDSVPSFFRGSGTSTISPTESTEAQGCMVFDEAFTEEDKQLMLSISERQVFKKGEVILNSGDLYQRLYQIEKGSIEIVHFETQNMPMEHRGLLTEGDAFGEMQIVQLRPCNGTFRAASDEVVLRVINGHTLIDQINRHPAFGMRAYLEIARLTQKKIVNIITFRKQMIEQKALDQSADITQQVDQLKLEIDPETL